MKRRDFVIGASGFLLSSCTGLLSGCASLGQGAIAHKGGRPRYIIRYGFVLTNPKAVSLSGQKMWLYAPLKKTSHQSLISFDIDTPYEQRDDGFGNNLVLIEVPTMAPFSTRMVEVEVGFDWTGLPSKESIREKSFFLNPENFIESDTAEIIQLSATLKGESEKATANAIYSWVKDELKYAGYIANDLGARYALKERKGDCTEYSYLVCALARAGGIPARAMGGYVVSQNAVLRAEDYHNWAELYYDGAWNIVDAQKGQIERTSAAYVGFEIISSLNDGPMKGAHRYRVEGDMKVSVI